MIKISGRGHHEKVKPECVVDYNKFKCGVDRQDQMLSYNLFQRKSVKWFLDICITCSYYMMYVLHAFYVIFQGLTPRKDKNTPGICYSCRSTCKRSN